MGIRAGRGGRIQGAAVIPQIPRLEGLVPMWPRSADALGHTLAGLGFRVASFTDDEVQFESSAVVASLVREPSRGSRSFDFGLIGGDGPRPLMTISDAIRLTDPARAALRLDRRAKDDAERRAAVFENDEQIARSCGPALLGDVALHGEKEGSAEARERAWRRVVEGGGRPRLRRRAGSRRLGHRPQHSRASRAPPEWCGGMGDSGCKAERAHLAMVDCGRARGSGAAQRDAPRIQLR